MTFHLIDRHGGEMLRGELLDLLPCLREYPDAREVLRDDGEVMVPIARKVPTKGRKLLGGL